MKIRNEKGQFLKGYNGLTGFKHSEKSKQKTSLALKKLFKEGRWKPGVGRKFEKGHPSYWTEKSKEKVREKLAKETGEKNRNWRGGISGFTNLIRKSKKYKEWRKLIFERDKFTCLLCGIRSKRGLGRTIKLEVDHYPESFSFIMQKNRIKSVAEGLRCDELWNMSNGRTLCKVCHDKTKNGRPKKL